MGVLQWSAKMPIRYCLDKKGGGARKKNFRNVLEMANSAPNMKHLPKEPKTSMENQFLEKFQRKDLGEEKHNPLRSTVRKFQELYVKCHQKNRNCKRQGENCKCNRSFTNYLKSETGVGIIVTTTAAPVTTTRTSTGTTIPEETTTQTTTTQT